MGETLYIGEAQGPCEVHAWTELELRGRLVPLMRARHGKGGVTVCEQCIVRARDAVACRWPRSPSSGPRAATGKP